MSRASDDTPAQNKTAAKKTKRIAAITAIVLATYVVSAGPALWLMRRELVAEGVIQLVYKPLGLLDEWRPFLLYQRWWYYTKEEREVILAEETWTGSQWLQHAITQLEKRGAPPTTLTLAPDRKEWAAKGYLLFVKGWAAFESHSSHDSARIGDIGLLRTSDGAFYTNDFHYCLGESEYHGSKQAQPNNFLDFLERYGNTQKWKQLP
ncbi:MAG: hypothetical protein QM813_27600 [Verrucomicrobiota bacterium]